MNCSVLLVTSQYITIKLHMANTEVIISFVHASCDNNIRIDMQNDFVNFNSSLSWMIVGDFNTVTGQNEKLGGKPI